MTARPTGPARGLRAMTSTVSGLGLATAAGLTTLLIGAVTSAAVSRLDLTRIVVVVLCALAMFVVLLPVRVSVTVNERGVWYRRLGGQERWVPADAIACAEAVRVGLGAVIGWGISASTATDRRIVGAGWALHLRLTNHEEIWLSTRGPLRVETVLTLPDRRPTGAVN